VRAKTMDNPYCRIQILDRLSGVRFWSTQLYKKKHAERIAKKRSTFRYTYTVVE